MASMALTAVWTAATVKLVTAVVRSHGAACRKLVKYHANQIPSRRPPATPTPQTPYTFSVVYMIIHISSKFNPWRWRHGISARRIVS